MHNRLRSCIVLLLTSLLVNSVQAMGLRSLVALPVDKGGTVARMQYHHNIDADTEFLIVNAAYGLSSKQTFLFGLPYRLSPSGTDRGGDISTLYRHIVWQSDSAEGTRRLGLLGGVVIPTDSDRDERIQVGAVATFYKGRSEWDMDALWIEGFEDTIHQARYDIAWQYRLSPSVYPDWCIGHEWHIDLELGGRWIEGNTMVHQATIGLQSIHRRWVFEGGLVRDLNESDETQLILSTRFHF